MFLITALELSADNTWAIVLMICGLSCTSEVLSISDITHFVDHKK